MGLLFHWSNFLISQIFIKIQDFRLFFKNTHKNWTLFHEKIKHWSTGASQANLNFWDSCSWSKNDIWGKNWEFLKILVLWTWVIFYNIPSVRCFIEIKGTKNMQVLLFSGTWVISYDQKCFKHFFLELILTKLQLLVAISRENVKFHEKQCLKYFWFLLGAVYKPRRQNLGHFWPPFVDTFTK